MNIRAAAITLSLLVAKALIVGADEKRTPPLFKVSYGETGGVEPKIFSYSVWATGEVRYEPSSDEHNAAKTREPKTLHVGPEAALRAVNRLIDIGFLALQPEVGKLVAAKDGAIIRLDRLILTHSADATIEFHFEDEDRRVEIDDIGTLPWAWPALRKVENDLGITALVE